MNAFLQVKTVIVIPPPGHGDAPWLIAQLLLNCSTCGESSVIFAGHHLRAIVKALQEVIDAAPPELTPEGEIEIVTSGSTKRFAPENN
jgi:hypothetical protein